MVEPSPHFTDALKVPVIRWYLAAIASFTLAGRALAVIIGLQIYQITHSAAALGLLGLIEAIPAISLFLVGGHVADHVNRREILLVTRTTSVLCALGLAALSLRGHDAPLAGLYAVIFLAGVARGFADPAGAAFEAQIVPKVLTVNASSWITSTWISCAVIGPALIGFAFAGWGAVWSYVAIAAAFAVSCVCTVMIPSTPLPPRAGPKEPLVKSILVGWRFVTANQPMWAAMALDLFAVLFGGAIALLPVYAEDILHVGAQGLGLLNAAPSLGALVTTLRATHRPPIANAGRTLMWAVTGFGVSIIVFGLSTNFWLSMLALVASGVFDGTSMVIRRSMIRLLSPDALRGRVAAANAVFISASNELGAFESGLLAAWIGAVPCVTLGGVVTLLVVAVAAVAAPQLRRLRFDLRSMERA